MSEENTNKMNFFTRIITSIKDFDKYSIFAVEKTTKAIGYLAILILIFAFILATTFTYKFSASVEKGINYFKDNISEVTYDGEKLSINSRRRI